MIYQALPSRVASTPLPTAWHLAGLMRTVGCAEVYARAFAMAQVRLQAEERERLRVIAQNN